MSGIEMLESLTTVASVDRFIREVREARENGYEFVCASCGTGMNGDAMEMHVGGCELAP